MTLEDFERRIAEINKMRDDARYHRSHANFGSLNIEYAGWMQAADKLEQLAYDAERQLYKEWTVSNTMS